MVNTDREDVEKRGGGQFTWALGADIDTRGAERSGASADLLDRTRVEIRRVRSQG